MAKQIEREGFTIQDGKPTDIPVLDGVLDNQDEDFLKAVNELYRTKEKEGR
jgi:hypothetical protein